MAKIPLRRDPVNKTHPCTACRRRFPAASLDVAGFCTACTGQLSLLDAALVAGKAGNR